MAQAAAEETTLPGGNTHEHFAKLLGQYARRDGDKLILTVTPDDLHNIGCLVTQAVLGYLLNQTLQARQTPTTALAAAQVTKPATL